MLDGRGGERIPCSQHAHVHGRCDEGGAHLESATLPGGHQTDRSNAIRDVIADDLPHSRIEPRGLFAHLLPQNLDRDTLQGITPDIGARTTYGQPASRRVNAGFVNVYYDVKQVTQGCGHYQRRGGGERRGPLNARAREVPVQYGTRSRQLDQQFSRRADGSAYPAPAVQRARGLTGPIAAELQRHPPIVGLVVGSFQGASDAVHELQREVAGRRAAREWRGMGSRSYDEAYGMFLDDVRARWAGVFWSSWAALMLGRAACVGRADADVLRLGDPEGVGRLGRRGGGWPGVQPRTVRFSGGRGMDMGG